MSCQETFTAPSTRFGRARMRALVFFLALSSVSAWRVPSSSEAASKKPSAASPTEKLALGRREWMQGAAAAAGAPCICLLYTSPSPRDS